MPNNPDEIAALVRVALRQQDRIKALEQNTTAPHLFQYEPYDERDNPALLLNTGPKVSAYDADEFERRWLQRERAGADRGAPKGHDDRTRDAERLIAKLPHDDAERNAWLLAWGVGLTAQRLKAERGDAARSVEDGDPAMRKLCPRCYRQLNGELMHPDDPATAAFWHADGSPDDCEPAPKPAAIPPCPMCEANAAEQAMPGGIAGAERLLRDVMAIEHEQDLGPEPHDVVIGEGNEHIPLGNWLHGQGMRLKLHVELPEVNDRDLVLTNGHRVTVRNA